MATYYVATAASGGDDSNPGTVLEPWLTFAHADTQISAGDTVRIRGGTYDQRMLPSFSGSSGALVTYTNHESEEVIVRGVMGQEEIVRLHSRAYYVIDGIKFTHIDNITGTTFGWIEMAFSGCHHNVIRNCTLERLGDPATLFAAGYREYGIEVTNADDNAIEDCHIRGLYMGAVITNAPERLKITGNTITETIESCLVIQKPTVATILGILVENNVLERSWKGDGLQFENSVDDYIRGVIVRGNTIRRNAENAIDLKGTRYILIEGNLIYGSIGSDEGPRYGWNRNGGSAIHRGSGAVSYDGIVRGNVVYDNFAGMCSYEGYRVYNNTFVSNNRDYTGPDSHAAGAVWQGIRQHSTDIKILNNIFVGHYTHEVTLNMGVSTYIDYNLYYNSDGELFEDRSVPEDLAWAAWRTRLQAEANVTGEDEHSVIGDPLFTVAPEHPQWNVTEYTKADFRLRPNSPAIDAGIHLTRCNGGGTGTAITVDDASFFCDGHDIADGDDIIVGTDEVTITDVDYSTNIITVNTSITWNDNDVIVLDTDNAANIGALEAAPPQGITCMVM